ncbi:MAG: DUF1800 domain-containing protein [Deltaproteobacteria bacterium]|nr:DUF1800 domain-containing protein [Deltaproteobacteria bacterium]
MSRPLNDDQIIYHFLNRTSFGPTREEFERATRMGINAYLEEQLNPESISDSLVEENVADLRTMRLSSGVLFYLYPPPRLARERGMNGRMAMAGPRIVILELQQARLLRSVYSRRQLYEVMTDFWSNHFNIFAAKGAERWLVTSYDRDTIRPHALGKFKDLLRATAQSPAMLFYLDNWLSASPKTRFRRRPNNRKRGLNENYAREIMELHTLGVDGGYTEKDVREVARCFTGWTIRRPRGEATFVFDPRIHDDGDKVVLGTRITAGGGMEDGLRVIDILARHSATARLIATKLARRFIADDPPPATVTRAAETFRRSDGDIAATLRTIIGAPEFLAPESYRSKVKKPLEYVASALRATGADIRVTPLLLRYLARMGEPLFLAQPPTGYPDAAASWISPDMLLTRMNFASDLVANRIPGARVRAENIHDVHAFGRFVAPEGLTDNARAALSTLDGAQGVALLMAAPEFQRR